MLCSCKQSLCCLSAPTLALCPPPRPHPDPERCPPPAQRSMLIYLLSPRSSAPSLYLFGPVFSGRLMPQSSAWHRFVRLLDGTVCRRS
ncbi:hypothetical protein CesoFtcFv8_023929 [Champsocephalus esox]|uniref:Uncharacterized protein n=1 Tax=Champsocephalus esox TaxID=159716 RepID=A0AAN8B4X1_9TELE|nr:hypothetical protein CesoFtcFv8_023929 [Champsocephalus esox]